MSDGEDDNKYDGEDDNKYDVPDNETGHVSHQVINHNTMPKYYKNN